MLNKYANFSMPVYPTRRSACHPQEVYDTAKAEAGKIDLAGWGLSGRARSNVPFPIPKNGLEAIWNHSLRYLGGGLYRLYNQFPVRANGEFYKIESEEYRVFNQNLDPSQDNLLFAYLDRNLAPATLEGNTTLVHEPVDQVKQARSAWQYNSGSRRVRRAPELGYDNIGNASDGLRTFDQVDMYNGSPDRYDWKLVGKKEIYIPYNAYKLDDKSLKYKDIIQKNVLKSDLFRYELHRVWVVEATLRKGMKHVYCQAHVLSRRGHVADRLRGRVRFTRRAVARRHRTDDAVLRCEGSVLSREHLARPDQRRIPGLAADQRDQRALDVRPQGQVGRLPAGRVAPRRYEVADHMQHRCSRSRGTDHDQDDRREVQGLVAPAHRR